MRITEISGFHDATNIAELEAILSRQSEDRYNSFWLTHDEDEYPKLALLVKDDLATLNYFPKEYDAGFNSVGDMPDLVPNGSIAFAISRNRGDDVFVLNNAVLPFPMAILAAKDFFASKDLPKSIEWREL